MNGIIAVATAQRLLDVAVAVALLLTVAVLVVRLMWQPAKRLWIIQWSLIGGLLIAVGLIFPWSQFSLGVLGASDEPAFNTSVLPHSNRIDSASMYRNANAAVAKTDDSPVLPKTDATSTIVNAPSFVSDATSPIQLTIETRIADEIDWSGWIIKAYAAGVIGMMGWVIVGQYSVRWLVRRASLPAAELLETWQQLQTEMQTCVNHRQRNPRLLVSDDLAHPVAVGVFRPAVLLPRWLVESQSLEELRPVLAHELAHVIHQDAALRWVAAAFQVVFFYQPLFWWLRRELRLCQEYLADAQGAACARSAPEYAEQLVALLKAPPTKSRRPLPAIGILEGRSELYRRIQMLIAAPRKLEFNISRHWNLLTAIALLIFAPALGLVTLQAAAPAPQETPAQNEIVKADESKKADQPEFRFQVVDARGKPVIGAKVQVWAFSFSNGSSGGPEEKLLPSATTHAEGIANLVLTKAADTPENKMLQQLYDQGIWRAALRIEHPDHPTLSEYFEVGADAPIVLQDSTTLEIRAHRADDNKPLTRLYPSLNGPYVDWSEADGLLTVRRVDLGSKQGAQWLRVVHVPETGPAWFGDLINLRELTGNPISINAALKPGVRVEGRLGDEVPRPVIDGKVVATIVAGAEDWPNSYWQAAAEVATDGTFAIESLPADENLQLIAYCDGWVSSNPTNAELNEYEQKYGFKNTGNHSVESTTVCPQMLRLESTTLKPTISMQRTGACEVTVVDQDGQPIADAMVAFSPNQLSYHGGTSLIGDGSDLLTYIREMLKSGNHNPERKPKNPGSAFTTTTNKQGIAVVGDLPAGNANDAKVRRESMFFVWREGYATVANLPDFESYPGTQPVIAKLSPGEIVKVTARMRKLRSVQKTTSPQADLPDVADDELAGYVVDEQGKPLEGVKVLVWEQDGDKIRTDQDGMFRHKFEDTHGDDEHLLVRFIKPGYAPYLIVDWKLGLKNQTVVLSDKTYFEGTVTGPDGKPAANVLIRANQGPKQDNPGAHIDDIWTETRTDESGKYKLLVQPDTYAIDVRAAGIGTARIPKDGEKDDAAVENANLLPQPQRPKLAIEQDEAKRLDIKLDPGVEFRATIVDLVTGKPVPNVRLWHWQYPGIEGRADNNGIVTIPAMPDGEFTFMIDTPKQYVRGWSDEIPQRWKDLHEKSRRQRNRAAIEQFDLNHGLPFDLQPGMPQVTIKLEPGVTITGRVLDPDGEPVVEATVATVRTGTGRSPTGDTRYNEKTIGGGFFTVVLPPSDGGTYNLMVHDGEYHKWRHWANGIGPVFESKPGQAIDNVELRLSPPGIVRGRIVDKFGKPVTNVYVQTTAEDGLESSYYNPSTRSDKDGNFELRYVRPGKHRVHGWMWVKDDEDESKFPQIEVTAGETTKVGDIVIPPQFQDRS